jgi:methylmalonyl-CoA mutase N-terminal domain/subunit
VQELAFTLRDGIEYVDWALERGLAIDSFAPRLSFFFNAHNDFFEEIAKFRAARALWAELMRKRYGAKDERSWKLRTHAQTAGCSLTWQQPYNNIVRTSLQGLAAVLGGTQSLHTNSLDEAYALPSQEAATIALRTQQIIAHESGIPAVADPLGGSYFVESLTAQMLNEANGYIRRIDDLGGMIPAIERGFPQGEIAKASYDYQKEVETGERKIVGVNDFGAERETPIELLRIDDSAGVLLRERLVKLKAERDETRVGSALDALKRCAAGGDNTMPYILEAVRAYATVGEICDVFRGEFGTYTEPNSF